MSKRSSPGSDEDSPGVSTDEPFKRQRLVEFEPVRISSFSGTSDIDAKVLAVQHYKLSERFRHKERQRDQLQKRVEQLENRQAQDDAMLCIINRSWNRFDEDVRLLLQRFDAETASEGEVNMECEGTKNFLAQLSHWESEEIDEKLQQRVSFSRRALSKLVQVFDHMTQRNEKIAELISSFPTTSEELTNEGASTSEGDGGQAKVTLNEEVARRNSELSAKNTCLQKMVTLLQSENHSLSTKVAAQEDELTMMETRKEEMSNSLDEVKYELEKSMRRECKLDYRLAEYARKAQELERHDVKCVPNSNGVGPLGAGLGTGLAPGATANVSRTKLEELEQNLEIQSELAASRLQELQEMLEKNKNITKQFEVAKGNLKHIPSEVITSSAEYVALQTQFSQLFTEATQMRKQLEASRAQMDSLRASHAKLIEVMESEECLAQERQRDTMLELEEQLSQVRREYEMLRLEFEQNLSANEQSGPVNKEIRVMLSTYKTQNQQLKQESNRFKRKWKEAVSSLAKTNKELENEKKYRERCVLIEIEEEGDSLASPDQEKNSAPSESFPLLDGSATEHRDITDTDNDVSLPAHKLIPKLRKKISELQSRLEALATLSADQRDRVELLARERRLKLENEKLQTSVRKLASTDRRDKIKYYSEEAQRKIRSLEELTERLRKEAHSARQEEEGLMNDVETTGQAFEEMQEQNTRLLQQLKEKDDANLKLMAERIRANQYQKKMNEEKERFEERISSLQNQLEAQQLMNKKLEENDKLLIQKNTHVEHRLRMLEQAMEVNKRKAIEYAQSAADMKAQLEKCNSQLSDAQQALISKMSQQETDAFNIRRLEEEKSVLKKKYERSKKMEKVDNMDEVLNEEIRELKDLLTCPSCKVRRKDAVLTKCFHVFCMDCMKTRYETRRRKCPRCNAAFGANDYRRLYFS